ncbi:hypothetical protein AT05_11070 [Schleiferia thermophila str. Yellowstone]|jgi:hypothetical protein|uniref:hypothetical protein n=1 Tax=Schleiferia thermophila TaxID=884107 RepID=UPI0004E60846|nr:hypothetical protein [Schleiferia thermophila]KFD38215.1 hypothetical protein AT05_11070 [Schleiferia thermophila str. Yellowstone]
MKLLILTFLIAHFNAFCQNENMVEIKMDKYIVSEELESKIAEILNRVKPEDSKLTFIISVSSKDAEYLISIGTAYDIDLANNNYAGFFFVKDKSLLIYENVEEEFFKYCGKGTISINKKKSKSPDLIVEPYIDELPNWIFKYRDGEFINVYSSY